MENFIMDLMYAPVATIWNEKIVSAQKFGFCRVDMNILWGVEGDTWFGSPWVVQSMVVGVDVGFSVVEVMCECPVELVSAIDQCHFCIRFCFFFRG